MDLLDLAIFIAMDDGAEERNLIRLMVNELADPMPNDLIRRQRGIRPKNEDYYELTVPRYDNDLFNEHFRMSRTTFENLVNVIGHAMINNHNRPVELRKKVMFTIWILAKPESYLAAGDRFGLAKSTGHLILREIVTVLTDLLPEHMTWPNREYQETSIINFRRRSHGFPGVVGAIDGCHIPCTAPPGNPNDFYNRKGHHSIILQSICDQKARFIDVVIGFPGRMHDARVFRQSEIFQMLTSVENPLLPPHHHKIGDSAYPLLLNVMTPFKDTGHLNRIQVLYNKKLSSIRSIIERAFGQLVGQFRRLKQLDIADFDLGNTMIGAACVFNNFLINSGDTDMEADIEVYQRVRNVNENEENRAAIDKRNTIAQMFR